MLFDFIELIINTKMKFDAGINRHEKGSHKNYWSATIFFEDGGGGS